MLSPHSEIATGKVKSDLAEGEKLLNEQEEHILLADKSEYG